MSCELTASQKGSKSNLCNVTVFYTTKINRHLIERLVNVGLGEGGD